MPENCLEDQGQIACQEVCTKKNHKQGGIKDYHCKSKLLGIVQINPQSFVQVVVHISRMVAYGLLNTLKEYVL